jgi:4-diphosphocytidyl-2-C-methyl-D-erythritol kinase
MERRIAPYGADCAFFVREFPAFATGIGDQLTPINLSLKGYHLLLVKPNDFVSTKEAYAKIDAGKRKNEPHISFEKYVGAIENRDTNAIGKGFYNIFEDVMSDSLKDTFEIKRMLKRNGALAAQMSGSGPTLVGYFSDVREAQQAREILAEEGISSYVCHAIAKNA